MSIHVFGIRHHGPGCARSLGSALESLEPDIVLVEGPPDAQDALPFLTHKGMQPPVALLIYRPDMPQRSVYYPFTYYSPEWQALQYAVTRSIPARFMDLPQAIQFAREPDPQVMDDGRSFAPDAPNEPAEGIEENKSVTTLPQESDPLSLLAEAAGFTDHELWWERQIELRRDATSLFESIMEAMIAIRSNATDASSGAEAPSTITRPGHEDEPLREAYMRQTIRAAQKEGYQRIAVVCGAWHAPVLAGDRNEFHHPNTGDLPEQSFLLPTAKADAALLSGLKRVKVEVTWIPWTNSRLAYRSGYGAGVTSPGWYEHLWTAPDRVTIRWITRAAHLLREEGLDTSSASVIEAVRLAEALAALRDLTMSGLAELHEAIETVLCNGDPAPMQLIRDRLEIGEKLGEVPPETPAVPLQRDLEAKQRRLRLQPAAKSGKLELDLRNDTDRSRSQLLHQLHLLSVAWGTPLPISGAKGTFHEHWTLQWKPEFAVTLIEANIWGNTVETATTAFVTATAEKAGDLPQLTSLLDKVILAGLSDAVDRLLAQIQDRAAIAADVRHLMDALPPLANVARYGNVRGTRADQILPVFATLFERVIVGLPGACASLDDAAAADMVSSINHVQESIDLLDHPSHQDEWQGVLRLLIRRDSVHGLVRGRCCRLLLEHKALDEAELHRLARLALSPVTPAAQAAAWVEGALRGSGFLLLHLDGLWVALDSWLGELAPDTFVALLPLLRRAFSGFQPPERRKMGEKVKQLPRLAATGTVGGEITTTDSAPLNRERAATVLPVLAHILGVKSDG